MTTPDTAALEALEHSRQRMRAALHEVLASPKLAPGAAAGSDPPIGAAPRWPAAQPLRQAAGMLAEAAHALAQPVARKHPLALVLGAAAMGGLLVVSRPWRWFITPALLAGLVPRLLVKVVGQLPRGSWLALLTALVPAPMASPVASARPAAGPRRDASAGAP